MAVTNKQLESLGFIKSSNNKSLFLKKGKFIFTSQNSYVWMNGEALIKTDYITPKFLKSYLDAVVQGETRLLKNE